MFSNSIAGGSGQLVRNQLQSDNFVSGVSGWRIKKDGTAEFNTGTFRTSLIVGPNPGAHIAVDSGTDTILVYDAGNNIIASMSPTTQTISGINVPAGVATYDPANNGNYARIHNGQLELFEQALIPTASPCLISTNGVAGLPALFISSGSIGGVGSKQAILQLVAENSLNTQSSYIIATQQLGGPGNAVSGQVMQSDGASASVPFIIHAATYTFTTDAGGNCTFNHGCGFTPTQGFLVGVQGAANPFYEYAWFANPFTSTTAHAHFNDNLGANYANMVNAAMFGVFFGK